MNLNYLIDIHEDIEVINQIANGIIDSQITNSDIVLITAPFSKKVHLLILALTRINITYSFGDTKEIKKMVNPFITINCDEDILLSSEKKLKKDFKNECLAVLFSSGTTGSPKGIKISRIGMYQSVNNFSTFFKPHGKLLVLGDLSSISGLRNKIFLPLIDNDIELIYDKKFSNVLKTVNFIKEEKIETLTCIPILLERIMDINEYLEDLGDLKYIISSGSELKQEVVEFFNNKYDIKVYNNYGLTETTGCIIGKNEKNYLNPGLGTSIFSKLKIKNNELLVQSNLMLGYFGNLKLTREKIDFGWFKTGDIIEEKNGEYFYKNRIPKDFKNKKGDLIELSALNTDIKALTEEPFELTVREGQPILFTKSHSFEDILENILFENRPEIIIEEEK